MRRSLILVVSLAFGLGLEWVVVRIEARNSRAWQLVAGGDASGLAPEEAETVDPLDAQQPPRAALHVRPAADAR